MAFASTTEKTRTLRYGRRVALIALGLLVAGVLVLDHRGLLKPLDDLAYDTLYPWQNRWRDEPPQVLMIDATGHSTLWTDEGELVRLVKRLQALGARRIGIALEESLPISAKSLPESVVMGRPVIRVEEDPTLWRLVDKETNKQTNKKTPENWSGRWGCFGTALSRRGMCREYRLSYPTASGVYPSFEAVLTEGLQSEADKFSRPWEAKGDGRIFFSGGVGSLPHVPVGLVINDRIVPELVDNRVILLGGSPKTVLREFHTPTSASLSGMRLLEIQGHTVNTLLTGLSLRETSGLWRAILSLLVTLVGFFIFIRCTPRIGFLVLGVALGLLVVSSVFALTRLEMWLPVVPMGLLMMGTFAIVSARKVEYSRIALNHLLFDLSTRIWQRNWPTAFFSQEDPWPEVISFVRQTLDLNRLIILELPAKRHHVTEVNSFNCSLADIQEMRRDIRRWPYTEAVAKTGPYQIEVAKRPFLRPLDSDESLASMKDQVGVNGQVDVEDQYLVPLRFAGVLFGFLAAGVFSTRIRKRNRFEQRLADIASQTAELLYQRHYVFEQQKHHDSPLALLGRLPEETAFSELSQATRLLERRLSRYEQILHESGVSTAIYDLFGQLMMANGQMRDLMRREGANIDEMTTVDLLHRLTGRGLDEVRELLGQVIVQKHCESAGIELDEQHGSFMLHVRPLTLGLPRPDDSDDETAPFEIQGILCELVDRSAAVELYRMKDNLTETLGHSLRNDLGAIELATSLIVDKRITKEAQQNYEAIVHAKVSEAAELLREARNLLLCEDDDELTECVPIDPQPLLERAIRNMGERIEARRLSIQLVSPDLTSHAFAVPIDLKRILEAILSILIQDAREGTTFDIRIEERMTEVVLHFDNEGFGVSTDKLRQALEGSETAESFEPLRGASDLLNQWGGNLVASGAVGEGIELALSLRRFS